MKKNGFITVFSLIMILFILISGNVIIYLSELQLSMANYNHHKVQAKYNSEDEFNRIFYDKEIFYGLFKEIILKDSRNALLNVGEKELKSAYYYQSNKYPLVGIYRFIDIDGRRNLLLELKREDEGVSSSIEVQISVINPLLELGQGLISPDQLLEDELEVFESMMEELHEKSFDYESFPTSSIYVYNLESNAKILLKDGKNKELYKIDDGHETYLRGFRSQVLVLNIIDRLGNNLNVTIGDTDSDATLSARGSLYIEGDLIIEQNFHFDGIIIINGGRIIVNSEEPATVNGMVLYNGEEEINEDSLIINYDRGNLARFGSYIPTYISPEIRIIKYF